VTFTPASANYAPSTKTVTLTVTPAATTITWNTPAAIVYGTALSSAQLNATVDGGIAGTLVYTPLEGVVLNAGTHELSVTFTPASANYAASTKTVTLTVTPAATTITWNTPAAIVYGTALSHGAAERDGRWWCGRDAGLHAARRRRPQRRHARVVGHLHAGERRTTRRRPRR
jgi:surface antigen